MKCLIGTCPRPAEGVIEGQARCRLHLAEVAPALAAARSEAEAQAAATPATPPPSRRLFSALRSKTTRRFSLMPDRSQTKPLLVKMLRQTTLGRDRLTGATISGEVGQTYDLTELEIEQALTPPGTTAVEVANLLIKYKKAERVAD
jgi:hypothetical protein